MQGPSVLDAKPDGLSWRGDEVARSFVEVDSQRLAYAEAGEGPAVVLIHGTLTALDDMVLALSDALGPGRRFIAFDRPGFGRSARDRLLGAGIFSQARKIGRALDRLGVERPFVVGHSFGASVAVALAILRPETTAGVVALAPLVMPEWRLEHLIFGPRATLGAGDLLATAAHEGVDRGLLPLLWRAMFLPQSMPASVERAFPFRLAGQTAATIHVGEDSMAVGPELVTLMAMARTLATPLEVMGGDSDLVVNNALHGQVLARLAPQGRFTLLSGVGHMVHHAAPDRVAELVTRIERGSELHG